MKLPRYELHGFDMSDYRLMRVVIWEPIDDRRNRFGRIGVYLRERAGRRARAHLKGELQEELAALLDGHGDNALLYEDGLPKDSWVRELLPLPEFEGYLRREWVCRMLPCAVHPHFVALGSVPYIGELFRELAPRMKSLLWIAPDLTYQEQLEKFAEDFFQEYGLAINLHFVPANGTYAQMRISDDHYRVPVNVLDFTEERYVPCFDPPEGSVWLDLASVREKERRIEARRLKAAYLSLKKRWREQRDPM